MYSTAEDMSNFSKILMNSNNSFLSQASKNEMVMLKRIKMHME